MAAEPQENAVYLAALELVTKLGWKIFPVHGGERSGDGMKQPATEHGFKDASDDLEQIERWFAGHPLRGIGLPCGEVNGILLTDLDGEEGVRSMKLMAERSMPDGPVTRTPGKGGGWHVFFKHPGYPVKSTVALRPGVDIRADGSYVILPPSPHPNGAYRWVHSPFEYELPDPPAWLLESLKKEERRATRGAEPLEEKIPQSKRHKALLSLAGKLRRSGLGGEEIAEMLLVVNERRCEPPLPDDEVHKLARSMEIYEPADPIVEKVEVTPEVPAEMGAALRGGLSPIESALEVFRKWLYLPDPTPLHVTAATVLANMWEGDPVWLMLVAPPGSGKTEILNAFGQLANVTTASTISGEGALLSGTPKAQQASNATGGLLRTVGDNGILLLKDFTSMLSMHRDDRGRIMAALREIYDGRWERVMGVDGGRVLSWHGKMGLVAGVTPAIDRHSTAMTSLGERFIYYRFVIDNPSAQAVKAISHLGHEDEMRSELQAAITHLFAQASERPVQLSGDEVMRLVALASFSVVARSAVERDPYGNRDIELVPEPEAPARLVGVMQRMLLALRRFGLPEQEQWDVITRVAADSVPGTRMRAFRYIHSRNGVVTTPEVEDAIGLPNTTTKRVLEDLVALGILRSEHGGQGVAIKWWVNTDVAALYQNGFGVTQPSSPETSGGDPGWV